ncbi:MAG: 50S ribosomal protein L23 [Bacteroidales bacterium]|nr:50S ribosomal protein L23 [Bacteroidales bacterium]
MEILIKPIVTEKLTTQGDAMNRYGFVVDKKANKLQIKEAIEKAYNVSVESVNTMKYGGKRKTRYTRTGLLSGKTKSYKKAIITLSEGEVIDFYSNI